MNRKPVIRHLDSFDGRTIVISDIHGSLQVYTKLLEKAGYHPGKDRLILLGDLVEKGDQSLETLRLIMKQTQAGEVYPVMGNCDFVAKNILFSYRLEFLRKVLLNRKNSLIHEMIVESNLEPISETSGMNQLAYELRKRYLKELSFLNDLPHVLVTSQAIFAHSGIENETTFADDFRDVMTRFQFANEDKSFTRPVIVGHMPVSEYCRFKANFNPIFDTAKNIYSIDGGNAVKKAGQLNALVLQKHSMISVNTDLLPKVTVRHTTNPVNDSTFFLNWSQGEVDILEKGAEQSLVYSDYLHRQILVDNEFIRDGRASNYTNYELPLIAGHTVHLVNVWRDKAQVKHHGILGWTDLSNLDIDPAAYQNDFDLS